MAAGVLRAHRLLHLFKEELLQDIRLERGAGFAGHHHQRIRQIDLVACGPHLRRVSGVDDVQLRETGLLPKGQARTSGQRLEPPMPSSRTVREACRLLSSRAQRGKSRQIFLLPLDDVDPAQPLFLAVAGPQAGILLPEAGDFVVGCPVGGGLLYGSAKFVR